MTLEEMGALLRQERERQGITLEKAAAEIKISKKYLIALEEGHTKDLPHPVYAKGFIKNYARLLGLDPEEMGAVLSLHYSPEDEREGHRIEPRPVAAPIKERKLSFATPGGTSHFKPSLWLGVPLVLVFCGLVWFFFSSLGPGLSLEGVRGFFKSKAEAPAPEAPQPPKQAKPEAKPAAAPSPAPAAKPETKPEPEAAPAPEAAAPTVPRDFLATTPGSGGVKPAPAVQPAPASPSASEQEITPEKLAAEAQFASSGKQIVEINANQPASLEITTEDGQKRAFTLVKGQRLSLRFNDKVEVRFQQAPSVAIKLNGKDFPLEGGKADGRAIAFP